jgi:CRISPR/Cas system-associated exonuclease Cas4 (RecB family)
MPASRIVPTERLEDSGDAQLRARAVLIERAEVRDVLAWMRLLVDPGDAAAVVRALARPPIELRQVDLARVIALARRRKLDLVSALTVATEAPQVPPEARERIQRFVELHRNVATGLDTVRPDLFMGRLIERVGMRHRRLLAPEDAAEQRANLKRLRDLAAEFVRQEPRATARELARHLTAVALRADRSAPPPPPPSPQEEEVMGKLEATLVMMREEVLESVARIGGRLGELRLDTDLDIAHGVVRYLELLKLAALMQRPAGQSVAEAVADVNARLLAATTALEREIFQTSSLDETLLAEQAVQDEREEIGVNAEHSDDGRSEQIARARAIAPRGEPSLGPFLPRKGAGLALSASDIETYRSCPLRYKFARVLRIPSDQTLHQRFGIAVHQVLERYHSASGETLAQLLKLLEESWRRGGFGSSEQERGLHEKARIALERYHERLHGQDSEPVWFERSFAFRLGPHHLRGRVDRVDRLAGSDKGDEYELIDYKTSRPKTVAQLKDDIQLSLYALAARESWGLEASRQAYYYVLDDLKVPVLRDEADREWVKDTVLAVGEGILDQQFEPTPSHAACSICDYRIVCPAAEK